MTSAKLTALAALLGAALLGSSCASSRIAPDARSVLRQSVNRIRDAQIVQVAGNRSGDGHAPAAYSLTVVRPSKLAFKTLDAAGTRRIISSNHRLTLVDERANVYHTIKIKDASVDDVDREISRRFDYQVMGLELLGPSPVSRFLKGVTSGMVVGDESVAGVMCRRLSFAGPGFRKDIWISMSDQLPRQLTETFSNRPGQPRRTATMLQWTFNSVVPKSDFTFVPRPGSRQVDTIPPH